MRLPDRKPGARAKGRKGRLSDNRTHTIRREEIEALEELSRVDLFSSEPGKILLGLSNARDSYFVFPTQTAANSWAMAMAKNPKIRAVETDRFLGWDKFREKLLSHSAPAHYMPANRLTRMLWALQALKQNKKRPYLRSLLRSADQSTAAHIKLLARLAPGLADIAGASSARRGLAGEEIAEEFPELGDYIALDGEYRRFCSRAKLYEQSWLRPTSLPEGRFVLFATGLMDSYRSLSKSFTSPHRIEEYSPAGGIKPAKLLIFDTVDEELRWIFGNCSRLIKSGTNPHDICVSVPGLDASTSAQLRRQAERFCVPLAFHFGRPLSSYGFGRIVRELFEAAGGLSLSKLRAVLADKAIPLKRPDVAAKLLRYAASYEIPESIDDPAYLEELWLRTLRIRPPEPELREYYLSIRRTLDMLSSASDFASFAEALFAYRTTFLDESAIDKEVRENLETVFEELEKLNLESTRLGPTDPPLDRREVGELVGLALDTASYAKAERENAVSVYPFGVAALAAFPVHFVTEASLDSIASAAHEKNPFDEELLDKLGLSSRGNESDSFLDAYETMSAVFCQAKYGFSGYSAPHPRFFGSLGQSLSAELGGDFPVAAETSEEEAWRANEASALPVELPRYIPLALAGRLGRKSLPVSQGFAPKEATDSSAVENRAVAELLKSSGYFLEGRVKFTPYTIKYFSRCPFQWFMHSIPGMKEAQGSAFEFLAGDLAHSVIAEFVAGAKKTAGSAKLDFEGFKSEIGPLIQAQIRRLVAAKGPSTEPALLSYAALLEARLKLLFERELDDEYGGGECEIDLSKTYPEANAVLVGRADRLRESLQGDSASYLLVDYKKKNTPTKKECLLSETGGLEDYQIVSYVDMLEEKGKHVEAAMYWSIEDVKPTFVLDSRKKGGGRSDLSLERAALGAALASAASAVMSGKVLETTKVVEHCENCAWKPVCRARFTTERR